MVIKLDYDRPVRDDLLDGPLITTVNGEKALALHGLDVVNGKHGSLNFIRCGRYVYRPYPGRHIPEDTEDTFVVKWDNGSRSKLVFSWDKQGNLVTRVYKLKDGRWHSSDFIPTDQEDQ